MFHSHIWRGHFWLNPSKCADSCPPHTNTASTRQTYLLDKTNQTFTFCPWRFTIHTAVLPGGGWGSDSSPDASTSEEMSCSLMGEGNEESESTSLRACVSFCILFICFDISSWDTRSWRGRGALEVSLAPDEFLWSVSGLCSLPSERPSCLKFTWFLWRFRPFMTCFVEGSLS